MVEWAELILDRKRLERATNQLDREITELDTEDNGEEIATKNTELVELRKQLELLVINEEILRGIVVNAISGRPKPSDDNLFEEVKPRHTWPETEYIFPEKFVKPNPVRVNSSFTVAQQSRPGARPQRPPKFVKGDNFTRFTKRFKEHVQLCGLEDPNLHLFMLSFIECENTYEKLSSLKLSPQQKADIDLLVQVYVEEIFPPSEARAMRTELLALRQKSTESVEDFCFRIDETASKAAYETDNMRDESSLQALLAGIKGEKIKEELLKNDVSDYKQGVKSAMKMERILAAIQPPADNEESLPVFNVGRETQRGPSPRDDSNPNTYARESPSPRTNYSNPGHYRDQSRNGPRQNWAEGGYQNSYRRGRANYQVPRDRGSTQYQPPGGRQYNGNENNRNSISCWNCGENHYRRNCPNFGHNSRNEGRFQQNNRYNNRPLNGGRATRY